MNKKKIQQKNNVAGLKSRVINAGAKSNAQVQAYKKTAIEKATKEINKIEEDIKSLEQNKI